jgi:6-phosphogluconolactonase
MIQNKYNTKITLEKELISTIVPILNSAIEQKGTASILFSGGGTPKGLMNQLAKTALDWKNIRIGLVDDRMVEASSEFSNLALLKRELIDLIEGDKKPSICPLVFYPKNKEHNFNEAIQSVLQLGSIDVALLGMGTDGHFASLFPNDTASLAALDDNCKLPLVYTTAPNAPQERISFSWAYLKSARHIFLHITGQTKKEIIEQDRDASQFLPIDRFLEDLTPSMAIYWAP